jgi:hypothetical protein
MSACRQLTPASPDLGAAVPRFAAVEGLNFAQAFHADMR